MDRTDVLVFRSLFQGPPPGPLSMDPRISLRRIARDLGIDELTVRGRLDKLNQMGFLKGWRLLVNPSLLGVGFAQQLVDFGNSKAEVGEAILRVKGVGAVIEHLGRSAWVVIGYEDEASLLRKKGEVEKIAGARSSVLVRMKFPKCKLRLSKTDVRIITSLFRNPRKLYSQTAKELGVSSRTVRRRFRRLADGGAVFVLPSMDPAALQGALSADLLVEYSRPEAGSRIGGEVASAIDEYLLRVQYGDPNYCFYNLVFNRLSQAKDALDKVNSISGVKSSRVDLIKSRLESYDWVLARIGEIPVYSGS